MTAHQSRAKDVLGKAGWPVGTSGLGSGCPRSQSQSGLLGRLPIEPSRAGIEAQLAQMARLERRMSAVDGQTGVAAMPAHWHMRSQGLEDTEGQLSDDG